eukprot:scaffold9776_cov94-Skeletonema_dohrnii-CCMP3373.AAC.1
MAIDPVPSFPASPKRIGIAFDMGLSFFLRRSLSFYEIEKYSTPQDVNDIDPSIELRAKAKAEANDDKCTNLFLYLPDPPHFSAHGHGSQINAYILAMLDGTYLNRNVLLVEPPNDVSTFAGASQFGCPVDAFEDIHMKSPASSAPENWQIKENFPGGLSRLINHPTWLSGGCPMPCADTYTYNDWVRIATSPNAVTKPISCKESNGRTVNVIATGGRGARQYFYSKLRSNDDHFISNEKWGIRLGATQAEARIFSTLSDNAMFDYAVGLMIKAGFLRLQPWIARDVAMLIKSFDLFQRIGTNNEVYDSIHVRRGDKLIREARHEVGEVARITRAVYVATDDPVVVKEEIANLPNRIDERTVLWNDCHELSFYFNPTDESSFHLNGDGETGFRDGTEDTCFNSGEFNSNWGRLLRTMRVRLYTPILQDDGNSNDDEKVLGDVLSTYSTTLDMRIAWGPTTPRLPGE